MKMTNFASMNKKTMGHLAMASANVMWGIMAPVSKSIMAAGAITPLAMTNFRMAGGALLFWAASFIAGRERVPAKDLLLLCGASLLGIVLNQGCYMFGVSLSSPGDASIITTTMPMWAMLLAAIFLKEPISAKKVGGILLGAAGALILIAGAGGFGSFGGRGHVIGNLLVLSAQFFYACYLVLYKNFITRYSMFTIMKWMFTFAAICVVPFSVSDIARLDWASVSAGDCAGVAFVVVGATFLSYICVLVGQKNLRPTVAAMYNYVQPVVAMTIAVILGLDALTAMKFAAIALIFTGVYLVSTSRSRNS